MTNHYETLGVDRDADESAIKRAYRKLAKRHHPDRAGGDHETMQRVQIAYDVLSDPERRKRYDETGNDKAPVDPIAQAAHMLLVEAIHHVLFNCAEYEELDAVRKIMHDTRATAIQMRAKHQKVVDRKLRVVVADGEHNLFESSLDAMRENSKAMVEAMTQKAQACERVLETLAKYRTIEDVRHTWGLDTLHVGLFTSGYSGT